MIRGGTLRSGDPLPSVRALRHARGVSPSTVLRAYEVLELERLIEARPRSGYYVAERGQYNSATRHLEAEDALYPAQCQRSGIRNARGLA